MIGTLMRVKHRGALSFNISWLPHNVKETHVGIVIARSSRHNVTLLTSAGLIVDISSKDLQTLTCEGARTKRRRPV